MALEFLESELRLGLKDVETLKAWQLHYLRMAEELLAWAGKLASEPELQAGLDLGADLCAAQAKRLGAMAAAREWLDSTYVHGQFVAARHEWRMRMERLEREEKAARAGVAA
jgi:hypothetical protein